VVIVTVLFHIGLVAVGATVVFIFGNFDGLAIESEQADNSVEVVRRQAWVGVDGKGAFLRKADNAATGIIVVIMRFEAALQ